MSNGRITCGFEVDDVVRGWIQQSGYGDCFTHRTGHNIGIEVHGNGVNMDNFESKDERQLVEGICFSIEPGIYFSGDFGVRTEIDVFLAPPDQGGVVVSTAPVQTAVSPLL
jgi:Xaa-Pro aminopeptidase